MELQEAPSPSDAKSDFRLFLRSELMRRIARNENYSLRAFAKALKLDHSTLSQILRGKRKISKSVCQKMCQNLGLAPEVEQEFIEALGAEEASEDLMKFHQLKMDIFLTISDWTHDAILELTRLQNFKPDVGFVARALGIDFKDAEKATDRLFRLGLLKNENDTWKDTSGDNSVLFDGAFTTPVLQAYQQELLKKSISTIDDVSKPLRDHTSLVLAVDSSLINEAKEQIKVFRRSLAAYLESKSRNTSDQVYSLQISLFPLTETGSKLKD